MFSIPQSIRSKTEAALHGDSVAMGTVFEWFRPRLYAHAVRICGNTPLAQDVVQDTFISAYTHLNSLRNSEMFYPWLKRILVNHCFRFLRKEKKETFLTEAAGNNLLLENSMVENFEKSSNLQSLYHAMGFLSAELRSCVMLRYFSNANSYEEISMVLDIPVGTVRSRLSAAREKLTSLFTESADAGDRAMVEANRWNEFYFQSWQNIYNNLDLRSEYYDHHHPAINVRFTSGKWSTGRTLLEHEINNDLTFGSRFMVNEVTSSGNISVIEGPNINGDIAPYRCAPNTVMIVFREADVIHTVHIFDAPRLPVKLN